jgi:hypothetical protein
MTNNELSRKVLDKLRERGGKIQFRELVDHLGEDARAVFKNLFFLEERGLVQLSTSYPMDAVYPQVHMAKLRAPGEELLKDAARLDAMFPLSDAATDTRLHIPPDLNHGKAPTYGQVLELLAHRVRETTRGEECDAIIEKIETLLGLPLANETIKKP